MRNPKSLNLVEALLILAVIIIIGNVGCSRPEAGKGQGAASEASQIEAKQLPQQKILPEKTDETAKQASQQKGQPEKTDETADWITYVSPKGGFSLRHPKSWAVGPNQSQYCTKAEFSFTAGADAVLVEDCGTEYYGQIYLVSEEDNQLGKHKIETDKDFYRNLSSRKIMVDNIEGTRESGTAMGQFSEKYEEKYVLPGLPDGTKVVVYSFYIHGRTYVAEYNHRIGEPDLLRDFDLMITKTLKFSN
jgi:hypothetical protein